MTTTAKPLEHTQFTRLTPLSPDLAARQSTPFPQRPPARLVPMRVLVLGLCRTGTSSLRLALLHLGFPDVYHMSSVDTAGREECEAWLSALNGKEKGGGAGKEGAQECERQFWDRMTGHVEALLDVPTSLFPEELLRVYPDAKVILSVRSDPDTPQVSKDKVTKERHLRGATTFATSVENTVLAMRNKTWWMTAGLLPSLFISVVPVPKQALVRRATFTQLFNILPPEERSDSLTDHERLCRIYEVHNQSVLDLCKQMGKEVLVYDCKEGWEPLVAFLNKGDGIGRELVVPEEEKGGRRMDFPRINDSAAFLRVVGARMQAMRAERAKKMGRMWRGAVAAFAVGLCVWSFWRRKVD